MRLGPLTLKMPAGDVRPGPAKLAARPSRMALHPPATPNTLPGRLDKVTYVGSHLEFVVSTEFGDVFVVSPDVERRLPQENRSALALPSAARC